MDYCYMCSKSKITALVRSKAVVLVEFKTHQLTQSKSNSP